MLQVNACTCASRYNIKERPEEETLLGEANHPHGKIKKIELHHWATKLNRHGVGVGNMYL